MVHLNLLRALVETTVAILMSVEAYAALRAAYREPQPERANRRKLRLLS